ncbi:MAG: glycosyltransferase family 39 protein [Chthoniobacter sp.]|nr:glycosyltransferase family 39 protein [Chthoniobacter sp.]
MKTEEALGKVETAAGGGGFWPCCLAVSRFILRPAIILPVLSIIYLCVTVPMLSRLVKNPEQAARFVSEDAAQYREIGQEFAGGDLSMAYVARKPHRQPLYPLLLAPALKLGGGGLFALGLVNIIIGLATLVALYFAVLRLFDNALVAALLGASFVDSWYLMRQVSTQLMTEPLFILLEIPIIYCFLRYVEKRQPRWLWLASAAAGLSYLARTNGLFVSLAMVGTLFCWDVWCWLRDRAGTPLLRLARTYAVAALIGVICTAPSWVPRLRDYGNPIFHGHLSNFMWVDTYEEARSHGEKPFYTWHDYAAKHTAGDAFRRWWDGFGEICYRLPYRVDHTLQWAAMVGIALALATRNRRFLLLTLFCFIQLQPLMWTSIADRHSRRIGYPGVVCFEWFLAAFALAWVAEMAWRRMKPISRSKEVA